MRSLLLITLVGAMAGSAVAQDAAAPPGARGGRARGAAPQQEAQAPARPAFPRAADALESVSYRTRTHVQNRNLTGWPFVVSAAGLQNLTFQEAVIRVDATRVNGTEGSNTQKVSPQLQKNLDYNLTAEELAGIAMGPRMQSYRAYSLGPDAESRRKTIEFAKRLGAEMVVIPVDAAPPQDLEALANELNIRIALVGRPEAVLKALEGRGARLGAGLDTGLLMEQGIAPIAALGSLGDKVIYASLRDRSALGANARNVMLGKGVGGFEEFFHEMSRRKIKPVLLSLDTTGTVNAPADIFAAVDAFEAAVQPAYGASFTEWSRTRTAPIGQLRPARLRDGTQLTQQETRRRIAAAVLNVPYVEPKQPRKLLIVESLEGMYHNPGIPDCNIMLQIMGTVTGAWETELNNDLENLKYPNIKKYDAVFFNSTVNEMFPDPIVRESLSRFVREGGGLGGIHGTPWASRNWAEFADMIGSQDAPHWVEPGVMKVYDPSSPIMQAFGGKDLSHVEEYYRFQHQGMGRFRWDKFRVLLTVDLDLAQTPSNRYKRPDNIYPVTWIGSYGQGRSFYCSLGHMSETFQRPEIAGHIFSGIQFILGDLEADTTPNPANSAAAQR